MTNDSLSSLCLDGRLLTLGNIEHGIDLDDEPEGLNALWHSIDSREASLVHSLLQRGT